MVDAKILEEKPVTMAELKEEIDAIKKRDAEKTAESNFRVTQADEYLSSFIHISAKSALELKKEIEKLEIPRLKDAQVCKIVDIMPETMEELKAILEEYPITIVDKNLKRIVELVAEYKGKK
jgi:DNA-directed RNA polymerase subunit F